MPSLFSVIAYVVATTIAVIGLYTAFGAWSLGKHDTWVSPLAVAWIGRCACCS